MNAVEAFFARPDLTLLLLVRVSVALFALPVLRAGTRVNAARLVIAVSLAMLLAPRILDTGAATAPLDVADYVVASLREVLTGLFLGFAASVAFETARFAGALIARDMGMGIAEMADPLNGSRSGTMALLFEVLALLLFFQWDAHHWLLQGIVESFERVPIGRATLRMEFVPFLIGLVSELFASGIVLAAPILCVLLLITVSMALVARAVPQMNVLEAGFAWRIGGAMVALVVFLPLIGQGMTRVAAQVREALFQALEVL